MLREKGTHFYDLAYWMAGSEPVEVYAAGGCLFDPGYGVFGDVDTAALTLRFASGALATLSFSRRTNYGYDEMIEVFGSKGMLQSRRQRQRGVSLYQGDKVVDDGIFPTWYERFAPTYVAELDALIAAVRTGVPMSPSLADGMRAQAVAEAAVASLAQGKPVGISDLWNGA
jgi:myo-inositol 2-dehydrogenase/D-chiro-inositol 1-dehydrogenase